MCKIFEQAFTNKHKFYCVPSMPFTYIVRLLLYWKFVMTKIEMEMELLRTPDLLKLWKWIWNLKGIL